MRKYDVFFTVTFRAFEAKHMEEAEYRSKAILSYYLGRVEELAIEKLIDNLSSIEVEWAGTDEVG